MLLLLGSGCGGLKEMEGAVFLKNAINIFFVCEFNEKNKEKEEIKEEKEG